MLDRLYKKYTQSNCDFECFLNTVIVIGNMLSGRFVSQFADWSVASQQVNSPDKLPHPRSDAYSAQQVLLNKQLIWCGGAYLDFTASGYSKSILSVYL